MDDQFKESEEESEEISEDFHCCVCLPSSDMQGNYRRKFMRVALRGDLLYKPIVLSCGHISCFWCIHRSMNALRESNCPICRHPYSHFPTVCQMFHFMLLKMYPLAYRIRENQTFEEEKKTGFFSPQFGHPNEESNNSCNPEHSSTTQPNVCSDPRYNRNEVPSTYIIEILESSNLLQDGDATISNQNSNGCVEVAKTVTFEEKKFPQNNPDRDHKQVLIADVLCAACNQLLFHPVVLNCGHVFCESCINNPAEEKLKCQVCRTMHPSGSPKICLELHHFLEKKFPEEYSLRSDAVQQLKQTCSQHESSTSSSTNADVLRWSDRGSKVHIGVGCDFCGMFPIIGDRYRCKDCVEKIGFDLCGDCYNTRSKLPGRFNQQHTPEHQFELMRSNIFQSIMLRLVTDRFGNAPPSPSSHDAENGSPPQPIYVFHEIEENDENDLVTSDATEGIEEEVLRLVTDRLGNAPPAPSSHDASGNPENGSPPQPIYVFHEIEENDENNLVTPDASEGIEEEDQHDDAQSSI